MLVVVIFLLMSMCTAIGILLIRNFIVLYDYGLICFMSISILLVLFFFFKQKTAYEMRISDWSSDVCSSDLPTLTACIGDAGKEGRRIERRQDFVAQVGGEDGDVGVEAVSAVGDAGIPARGPLGPEIGVADEAAGKETELLREGRIGHARSGAGVKAPRRRPRVAPRHAPGRGVGKAVVIARTRVG